MERFEQKQFSVIIIITIKNVWSIWIKYNLHYFEKNMLENKAMIQVNELTQASAMLLLLLLLAIISFRINVVYIIR